MPFQEVDVSRDQQAAREMVRLSGQSGVPVTVAGDDVIVGFDQRRLDQVASRLAATPSERPRLGMQIRDAPGGGAEIGQVRPGSPAEQAGIKTGDVVVGVHGRPVASAADVERGLARVGSSAILDVSVVRDGARHALRINLRP